MNAMLLTAFQRFNCTMSNHTELYTANI